VGSRPFVRYEVRFAGPADRRCAAGVSCRLRERAVRRDRGITMRHRKAGVKLKRDLSGRRALLRGLVTNVIEEERITTTVPKAKAAKPLVERMITLAKQDTLHARRQAAAF